MWLSSAAHNNCTINSTLRPCGQCGSPCYRGKLTLTSVTWAESPKTRYVIEFPKYLLNSQMWTHVSPAAFIFLKLAPDVATLTIMGETRSSVPSWLFFSVHLTQAVFVFMLQVFKLFYAFHEWNMWVVKVIGVYPDIALCRWHDNQTISTRHDGGSVTCRRRHRRGKLLTADANFSVIHMALTKQKSER